jgi:hypothetical protein
VCDDLGRETMALIGIGGKVVSEMDLMKDEAEGPRVSDAIVNAKQRFTSPVAILETALGLARPDKFKKRSTIRSNSASVIDRIVPAAIGLSVSLVIKRYFVV